MQAGIKPILWKSCEQKDSVEYYRTVKFPKLDTPVLGSLVPHML